MLNGLPRLTKDKARARATAIKYGRKVIWLDDKGFWHCATNRANTPSYAVESEDVK